MFCVQSVGIDKGDIPDLAKVTCAPLTYMYIHYANLYVHTLSTL